MKKYLILSAFAAVVALMSSCGTQKQAVASQADSRAPFGKTYKLPCDVYDTREKFAAVGIYRGSSNQKGKCMEFALENAKDLIYRKYRHTYTGMTSRYSSTIGNNRGNDIETKLQSAGDQVIKAMLDHALEVCHEFGPIQDDGNIEAYVAIEIYKDELTEKTAKKVADMLTPEEKEQINFNEYNYRKQMEERMQSYKEETK